MEALSIRKIFVFIIDQISLKCFFTHPDLNARKARWLAFLSEFEFDIKHIKEKENKIVDALNRHAHEVIGRYVRSYNIDSNEQIKNSIQKYPKYQEIQQKIQQKEIRGSLKIQKIC